MHRHSEITPLTTKVTVHKKKLTGRDLACLHTPGDLVGFCQCICTQSDHQTGHHGLVLYYSSTKLPGQYYSSTDRSSQPHQQISAALPIFLCPCQKIHRTESTVTLSPGIVARVVNTMHINSKHIQLHTIT